MYLAVLACYIVVTVFVFIDEIKRTKLNNPTVWIGTLWMGIAGSKSVSRWLNPNIEVNLENYTDGSSLDRNFLILMMLISLIILLKRRYSFTVFCKKNTSVALFILFLLISVSWSSDWYISMKRWIRLVGDLILVLLILTSDDPKKTFVSIIRRITFVLAPLSIIYIKYVRYIGVVYDYTGMYEMWVGVTDHKNSLGQLVSFTSLIMIWDLFTTKRKERRFYIPVYILLNLYLLSGSGTSYSSTSIGVFIIGLLLLFLFGRLKKHVLLIGKLVAVSFISLVAIQILSSLISEQSSLLAAIIKASGRDMTLTGRIPLWNELLGSFSSYNLFLGSGYGNFWITNIPRLWDMFSWGPQSAHNGFIDIFLESGAIGLSLLVGLCISAYVNCGRRLQKDFEFGRISFTLLLISIIHNFTESSFAKPTNFIWIIFLLTLLDPSAPSRTKVKNVRKKIQIQPNDITAI